MEHDDAIRSRCAERYIAGELSAEDRDGFEEHFFECAECAEEVRWEQIFVANARAVARENVPPQASPVREKWWRTWFPHPVFALSLTANAILLIGLGFFLLTGRTGMQPSLLPAYFAPPPSRSMEAPRAIPAGSKAIAVHFAAPDQKYPSYSYEIVDTAGNREASGRIGAPSGGESELYMEIPVSKLSEGTHTLEVRGDTGNDIVARFQFRTSH